MIGLPNQLHEEVVGLCATHGKAVLPAEARQWEAVQLEDSRGAGVPDRTSAARARRQDGDQEEKMPDGRSKLILNEDVTGKFVDVVL